MVFHALPLVPSRTERLLCPGDGPKTICSGTYTVTQADVDSGERNNTAHVTSQSPDNRAITDNEHDTVAVVGTSGVSIGEFCVG